MPNIRINEYRHIPIEVIGPDGKSIGYCYNDMEFMDLRVQIAREQDGGYTFQWKGQTVTIDSDGNLNYTDELEDFYNTQLELVLELRRIQRSREEPQDEKID